MVYIIPSNTKFISTSEHHDGTKHSSSRKCSQRKFCLQLKRRYTSNTHDYRFYFTYLEQTQTVLTHVSTFLPQ